MSAGSEIVGMYGLVQARLKAVPVVAGASVVDHRLWVQEFCLQALLLGTYAEVYGFAEDEWDALLKAIHAFGDPGEPFPARTLVDADLDQDPFSAPARPFLDAALAIVTTEGFQALTLERVAQHTGRSTSFMISAFGSIEALWRDVVTTAFQDGFDGLVPLRFDISRQSIDQSLAIFLNSRQYAAAHRILALTGIDIPADQQASFARVHARDRAGLPAITKDPEPWLLPLALDGWHLTAVMYGPLNVEGITPAVHTRLREFTRA